MFVPVNTFDTFAQLAHNHGATALASVLQSCTSGGALPEIGQPDPRPALNRFRRVLERESGFQFHYNQSSTTWSYGTRLGNMIEGFPRLDHALIAGIRHLVAPIEQFELRIATRADWTWLYKSGRTSGSRTFRLFDDTRLYWHIPGANMLLLAYTEPQEFGRVEPALAGFCFFGDGLVCVIESQYRGGGGRMLQWLQAQFSELIGHHVLSAESAQFLQRHGFVDVEPPLPASGVAEVNLFLRQQRDMLAAARQVFGIASEEVEQDAPNGRQRIMVWPASFAADPVHIATRLADAGLHWWYTSRSHRPSLKKHTPEERIRIADFMYRALGHDMQRRVLAREYDRDDSDTEE
jgi:hypothetical protein